MSTLGQPFTKPLNGGWAHLSVPTGKRYGLNWVGPATWSWHCALSMVADVPFSVVPMITGNVFCEPRPGPLHFDRSNRDLQHVRAVSRSFLDNLRTQGPDSLRFLPTEKEQPDRAEYLTAIRSPAGSTAAVKLVLRPDSPIPLGGDLGALTYVLYDSVAVDSLYDSVTSLSSWPSYEAGKALVESLGATHDELFRLFLMGLLEMRVQPGIVDFGLAARERGSARRYLDVKTFTSAGPVDPALVLWRMKEAGLLDDGGFLASSAVEREFVWDDQSTEDNRFDPGSTITRQYFEDDLSGRFVYPFSILRSLATRWNITGAAWRLVGDQQKGLHKSKLAAPSAAAVLSSFDWDDRLNVFQLEAAVESFCRTASGEAMQVNMLGSVRLGERQDSPWSDVYLVQVDPMYALGGPRVGSYIATGIDGLRAYDEYDGCMFVVAGGLVRWVGYGFSSFSSRRNENEGEAASSIEGNRRYLFRSRTSPGKRGHNYAFVVTRESGLDALDRLPAWFYWGSRQPLRELGAQDPNGKKGIVIHRGNNPVGRSGDPTTVGWNGSEGCQVAPSDTYYDLRSALCDVSLERAFDPAISAICMGGRATSELLWQRSNDHFKSEEMALMEPSLIYGDLGSSTESGAITSEDLRAAIREERQEAVRLLSVLPPEYWDGKVRGSYLLVRPFEDDVPLGGGRRRLVSTPSPFEK